MLDWFKAKKKEIIIAIIVAIGMSLGAPKLAVEGLALWGYEKIEKQDKVIEQPIKVEEIKK